MNSGLRDQSISDFGDQWTRFTRNEGYYASGELLRDILEPLLPIESIRGASVADIGSGTGRIVRMLAAAGASSIVAVEPSAAFDVLRENIEDLGVRVSCVRGRGEDLPGDGVYDLILSIGVLHHIPDPAPVLRRACGGLRSGGRILIWLYGVEGNRLYLAVVRPLRAITRRLPHRWLKGLVHVLDLPLVAYIAACRLAGGLPLAAYMRKHLGLLDPYARRLTIYDQLNPAWAKYYSRDEAEALVKDAGFAKVRSHHRHGYSWTVTGVKAD